MVKIAVVTVSTFILMFLTAVGVVLAQSPSASPSASPSIQGDTVVVPEGVPSTGKAL